ncbi:MAG: hypothetical protein KatS3mg059_0247 [Thermomicrobiales bacterium]|nr:MAG: hypothetical protein KatS3mg059_0247 [Thermomicrobiales bacterium]
MRSGFDGALVISKTEILGTTPTGIVQIGENGTGSRSYDIAFDEVLVSRTPIAATGVLGSFSASAPNRDAQPHANRRANRDAQPHANRRSNPNANAVRDANLIGYSDSRTYSHVGTDPDFDTRTGCDLDTEPIACQLREPVTVCGGS